jgi:hypothetical protein
MRQVRTTSDYSSLARSKWQRAIKFVSKFLKDLRYSQTRETFLNFIDAQIEVDDDFKSLFFSPDKNAYSKLNDTKRTSSSNLQPSSFLHASSLFSSSSSSNNGLSDSRISASNISTWSMTKNASFHKSTHNLSSFYRPKQKKLNRDYLKNDLEFYNETLLLNFLWRIPLAPSRNKSSGHGKCLKSNTIHQKIKTIISIYFLSSSDTDLPSYSYNLNATLIRHICRKFYIINKNSDARMRFVYDCACDKDHFTLFLLFQEARHQLANIFLPMYWLFTSERISTLSYSDFSFFIDRKEESKASFQEKLSRTKSTTRSYYSFNDVSSDKVLSDKCSNPRIIVSANRIVYEYPINSKKTTSKSVLKFKQLI